MNSNSDLLADKVPDQKCYWCKVPSTPLTQEDKYVTICKTCWNQIEEELFPFKNYDGN